jgi:hypothetical protein
MYCSNCLEYFTTNKTKQIIPEYYCNIVKNKEKKNTYKKVLYCDKYIWCSNDCYKEWCKKHHQCSCKYKYNPLFCNLIKKGIPDEW